MWTRMNNEMTDRIFKFQNIQLVPTRVHQTQQDTILPTEGTTEEQYSFLVNFENICFENICFERYL